MVVKSIDRRKFLQLTSTGIFSTLVMNHVSPLMAKVVSSGKNVSFLSKEFRKGIPTICNLCPAQCGILGFVQGDWLAGIQGNPLHPNNRGKICARAVAGMNLVYDPERLLFPMKRTGKRGEGKWTRVSWQEALIEIATKLKLLRQQGRTSEIAFTVKKQHDAGLTKRFCEALGDPAIVISSLYSDPNKAFAQQITWGETCEIPDVEHSRYILLFGANPFESHPLYVPLTQRIIEARLNLGTKLVTIDPRLSHTAGRSDEWLPIYPGTDGLLALTLANVIMQQGLHDADFINHWTNISVADLKTYLSRFTVEQAAKVTSLSAQDIERIALEFASRKPAIAITGSGVTKRQNGTQNERCVMLLNAVIGNIDSKGGFCLPRTIDLSDFSRAINLSTCTSDFYQQVENNQRKVGALIACLSNPAYEEPESDRVTQLLKNEQKIPFLIVLDHVMSETAALADIILPAATYLESWDLSVAASFNLVPQITMGQPVIPAQGQSKSVFEIWLSLAKTMGGDIAQKLSFQDVEDYIRAVVTQVPGLSYSRDYHQFKKEGVWISQTQTSQYERYRQNGFRTETRKFEIASTRLKTSREFELPQYVPISEKIRLKKEQLFLLPITANVLTPDLANSKWLSEIKHTNEAVINPVTARALKIRNGQKIKLQSKASVLEVTVRLFEGIHPQAIALHQGLGHWAYGKIAQAKPFPSEDPDTELLWWEKHGRGVNPNILVNVALDPLGKGQAWKDVVVEVKV